jgi:hypothetical protein
MKAWAAKAADILDMALEPFDTPAMRATQGERVGKGNKL